MNDLIRHIIQDATSIGVASTLEALGISSGEISYRQAVATYGSWFRDAAKAGLISPAKTGSGKNGKHSYRVSDILAKRVEEEAKAILIIK